MSSPIDRIASIIFPDHHRHTALKSAPDSVLGSTSRPPDKMAPRVASSGANAAAFAHHRALPAQPMTSLHTVDAGKVARAWPSTPKSAPTAAAETDSPAAILPGGNQPGTQFHGLVLVLGRLPIPIEFQCQSDLNIIGIITLHRLRTVLMPGRRDETRWSRRRFSVGANAAAPRCAGLGAGGDAWGVPLAV